MLVASNITIQFGAKPLFENISVKFGEGNRYGLIGANGSGKTTFMKILAGLLEPSGGNVALDTHERMAFLRQDQFAYEDQRVLDVVLQGHTEMWACMQEKDAIYANPEAAEEDYLHAAELESQFSEYDGYTAESRAGELLLGVGIPIEQHSGLMSAVAPGWKLRVLLVQALFANPHILLLDEPTNNGTLMVYPGNYDDYMEASTQARQRLLSANAKAKERVVELQDFVRRFSANKSKARQATSRAKLIEKIKVDDIKPSSRQYPWIRFEVDDKEKLHRHAVEIENLRHGFDRTLFENFSTFIEAGEKIAIIGENGVGKTTLLRCLAGEKLGGLTSLGGTVKWAEKARPGYFAQDHSEDFARDETLVDWIQGWAREGEDEQIVRSTLGRLLFTGDDGKKSVKVISGGEQGRMLFGKLILQKPNVLLMDEPTNHLDMESIESLNTALDKYAGTLIFVSHDREFVSSIATRILEIQDGKIIDYKGNYEEYLSSQGIE